MKQKFLPIIALLLMAATGAWAQWTGGTHTATANENLNAINVSDDATLTINQGVTVTVNGGIVVASGKTLTVNGGGTLVANGANGTEGEPGQTGNAGGTAIAGNVIINGVGLTVTATGGEGGEGGGGDKGSDGDTGNPGGEGGTGGTGCTGGNGGSAFSGAVTIYAGSVTATGGTGGTGGHGGGGGEGGNGIDGGNGGKGGTGGTGGNGGNGGYAFAGTLTVFGGNVNAYGGDSGQGGSDGNSGQGGTGFDGGGDGDIGEPGEMGEYGSDGVAYASNVTFQATTHTMTNGTDNITAATGKKTVIITSPDVLPGPPTYAITLAEGTEDADKWTISPNPAEAGSPVTVTYSGEKKVKSVKAVKKGAATSVPDGAISGVFSVSSTKKVYFSKGNLRYASGTWSFFDNQYDYYNSYSADAWDHFGWSTSAPTYGMNTSTDNSTYSGDFVDWGATMGTGWFTLSSDEWTYLLKTRSASTVGDTENGRYAKAKVNDVQGVILFPDTYTHPDGVAAPTGVNATNSTGWNGNNYSSADWTKMESAGCVFLPAAGLRNDSSVLNKGTSGLYWSASSNGTDNAYCVNFGSVSLDTGSCSRGYGLSVRLVREVTE